MQVSAQIKKYTGIITSASVLLNLLLTLCCTLYANPTTTSVKTGGIEQTCFKAITPFSDNYEDSIALFFETFTDTEEDAKEGDNSDVKFVFHTYTKTSVKKHSDKLPHTDFQCFSNKNTNLYLLYHSLKIPFSV